MDTEILTTAVQEINALHNIQCKIEQRELYYRCLRIDAQIQLTIGQEEILLNAEVKSKIVPAQIPKIVSLKVSTRATPYCTISFLSRTLLKRHERKKVQRSGTRRATQK